VRRTLSAASAGVLLCLHAPAGGEMTEVFRRASESVVKIEADDSAASGFLWGDGAHVVTSLHVVDGKRRVTVHYVGADGRIVASTAAAVERLLKESDLVLLRLQTPQSRKPLAINTAAPAVKQTLDALGFPLNIAGCSSTEVKVRFGGNQLRTILPPKVVRQITDYPSTSIEILNLEGNLVPGLSGAPIIDRDGRVVGVVDGGLEDGAIGISWGIPASHLQRLAQSNVTQLPGAPRVAELFAADLQAEVEPTKTLGGVGLTKLRSRTYQQLAATADDKLGLAQLTLLFQGFDPNSFRYDVYQDLASGATVVVPEKARVSAQGSFIVVSAGDSRMLMKIQIQGLASSAEAQGYALAFEQQLVELGGGVVVAPDPAWSYLVPIIRSGVTINRKAIYRGVFLGGQLQPDRYYFETLATNGRSLLAVAAVNNDSSLPTMNLEAACSRGFADERCAELFRARRVWAQMVLGVQFSSFPSFNFDAGATQ
jgi:S1-C subfamily serine protease